MRTTLSCLRVCFVAQPIAREHCEVNCYT